MSPAPSDLPPGVGYADAGLRRMTPDQPDPAGTHGAPEAATDRRGETAASSEQIRQLTERVTTLEHLLTLLAYAFDRSRPKGMFDQPGLHDWKATNPLMDEVWSTVRAVTSPPPENIPRPAYPHQTPGPEYRP